MKTTPLSPKTTPLTTAKQAARPINHWNHANHASARMCVHAREQIKNAPRAYALVPWLAWHKWFTGFFWHFAVVSGVVFH